MQDALAASHKGKGKAPVENDPKETEVNDPENSILEPSDATRLTGLNTLSPNSKKTFETS